MWLPYMQCTVRLIYTRTQERCVRDAEESLSWTRAGDWLSLTSSLPLHATATACIDNFHLFLPVFSLQIPLCIFLEGLLNRRKYFNLPLKWRSNGLLSKGFSLSIVYKLSFCLSLLTFVVFAFNPCVALQDNVQKKGNRSNNHITITITITLKNCFANQNSYMKAKLSPKRVQSPTDCHVTHNVTLNRKWN